MIGPKCNDDHKLTCCDEFKQVSATSDKGKAISETEREIMQEEKKKKEKYLNDMKRKNNTVLKNHVCKHVCGVVCCV